MKPFSVVAISLAVFGSLSSPVLAKNARNAYRLVDGKSSKSSAIGVVSKSSKSNDISAYASKSSKSIKTPKTTDKPSVAPTTLTRATFPPTYEMTEMPPSLYPTAKPIEEAADVPLPFSIQSPRTGKLLTISGGTCSQGIGIEMRDAGVIGQGWLMVDGGRVLSVDCPGFVLDLEGDDCNAGTSLVIAREDEGGRKSQYWSFLRSDVDPVGVIESVKCQGYAIDIQGYSELEGAHVWIWPVHFEWNQLWNITDSSNSTSSPPNEALILSSTMASAEASLLALTGETDDEGCADGIAHCVIDPCDNVDCEESDVCISSFCGGCFAVCEPASFSP